MFYLIACIECLAVSFLAGACASVVFLPTSRLIQSSILRRRPATAANILVLLRLLPAASGILLTLGFTLPAFLLFEPRPSNDYLGPLQYTLAVSGALIFIVMIIRAFRVLRASTMLERRWKEHSTRISIPGIKVPTYSVSGAPALFVVIGVLRPNVFVGREIIETLSASEMAAAAAHEMAHVRAHDNLKQLLLDISRPPSWLMQLGVPDEVWLNAAELAADQAALADGNAPLQLASALLKAARIRSSFPCNPGCSGSHLLPAHWGSRLEARVVYLVALADAGSHAVVKRVSRPAMRACVLLSLACLIVTYAATAHIVFRVVEEMLDVLF